MDGHRDDIPQAPGAGMDPVVRRLKCLLSASPAILYTCRNDGSFRATFVSDNVRQTFGYTPDDFINDPDFWLNRVHPEDQGRVRQTAARLQAGEAVVSDYRFRHADGRWIWTRDSNRLMRDEDGTAEIVGAWMDIDHERRALEQSERRTEEARRRLEDALEAIGDAFTLFDAEDRLVLCNSRYREFYPTIADLCRPGVTFADLLQASLERSQYAPLDCSPEEWLERRLARHRAPMGVFEQHLADGRWVEIAERRTRDGGRVAVRRDITARKLAENALRQQLAFDEALISTIPLPIFCKDVAGHYIEVNAAFAQAMGLPREQILGRTLFDIMPRAAAEAYAETDRKLFANPGTQSYEAQMRFGDGGMRDILVIKRTFNDADGRVAGFVGVIVDLTERKRQEQQMVRTSRMATLGQISSEIAHELSQPLSILRMAVEDVLERMQSGRPPAQARTERKLETVIQQADRMAGVLDHLRVLARPEPGGRAAFDPAAAIAGAVGLVRRQMELDGIEIAVHLSGPCGRVAGHAAQLEQVLLNLLSNARDAVRVRKGVARRIDVSAECGVNSVTIAVEDTGGGVPEPLWEDIFEPFFTTKEKDKGTGLGLSISASIVSSMDGTLTGRNTRLGARFEVMLPCHMPVAGLAVPGREPGPEPACDCPPPAAGDDGAGRRVLVVDDEDLALDCIGEYLGGRGWRVTTARNGAEALAAFKDHASDLVVTDLRMPLMDGHDLIRHLRALDPAVPVILMTGHGYAPGDRAEGLQDLTLRKPIALRDLERELMRLAGRRAETAGQVA